MISLQIVNQCIFVMLKQDEKAINTKAPMKASLWRQSTIYSNIYIYIYIGNMCQRKEIKQAKGANERKQLDEIHLLIRYL